MHATLVLAILSLAAYCLARKYTCGLHTSGKDFYEDFEFETIPDPTNGRVNYVDRETADSLNLTSVTDSGTFVLRADSTSVLDPSGPGRNSVRLKSKMEYRNHVAVFDVNHVPSGCATWPSISLLGPNWPHGGEIDILSGVNGVGPNAVTLHTGEGWHGWRQGEGGGGCVGVGANERVEEEEEKKGWGMGNAGWGLGMRVSLGSSSTSLKVEN
ncbi:hypothetical protein NMY22_g3829 [Coprinellus aureogranulatus]|nr:hypothetical protein NMY22_g3829 [Coprinellus aureogranulatus]